MRKETPLPEDRPVALRPGLWGGRHERDGVDGYLVFDPVTQRQEFVKGEQGQVLWRLGAGRRPSSLSPNLLQAARELWRRGWLALAPREEALPDESPAQDLTFSARSGASFSCGGCGLCCRAFHDIGPVNEQERKNVLSAAQLIERTRQRSAGEILQLSPPDSPSEYWPYQIATHKTRCLFLTPQSRCSIHEVAGAEQKPLVCRTFPMQLSLINGQARVIASSRCPSVSLTKGAPIEAEEIKELWSQNAPLLQPREPECGWPAYLEAERELISALDEARSEEVSARINAFSAFVARLGYSMPEPIKVGRLYATAKRLEQESRQKGGAPLAAVAWGLRWSLHQRAKSPARPWVDAIQHSKATRGAGEALRRYLGDQIHSGEALQYPNLTEGSWRLLQRSLLIEGHAKALVQAGLSKEPYATAESIYLWDFAALSEAWQFLSPNKSEDP